MNTSRRAAGFGLLVYGIVTPVAFLNGGAPGPEYSESEVATYISSGNLTSLIALAFLGGLAAFGILVSANRGRHQLRSGGDLLWGLTVAGTAFAVIGWFLLASMGVAFAMGGESLTSVVPLPIVLLLSQMALGFAIAFSSFFLGAAALVLAARSTLPGWLRLASYVGGLGGLLGALFFPLVLFWLWAIAFGLWAVISNASSTQGASA